MKPPIQIELLPAKSMLDVGATVRKFEKRIFESLAVSSAELGAANQTTWDTLGGSMMRGAYSAWARLKALQEIEAGAFFDRESRENQLARETEEELLREDVTLTGAHGLKSGDTIEITGTVSHNGTFRVR